MKLINSELSRNNNKPYSNDTIYYLYRSSITYLTCIFFTMCQHPCRDTRVYTGLSVKLVLRYRI